MVLLGINGIMRISWQFHGDILETSWEYDWAYHGRSWQPWQPNNTLSGQSKAARISQLGSQPLPFTGGYPVSKHFLGIAYCWVYLSQYHSLPRSMGFYQILTIIMHPKLLIQLGRIMWGIE